MSLPGSDFGSIARDGLRLPTPYEAPIGESETAIAEIFAEIFSVGRVGANDDFFDLGGDSLLAESLCLLIAERSGRDFQLSALMEHGTPRKIARGDWVMVPEKTPHWFQQIDGTIVLMSIHLPHAPTTTPSR